MHRVFAFGCFFLTFFATHLFAQEERLVKIPENSNSQIRFLKDRYHITLRYRTQEFSIVQVDQSALPELPQAQVLDVIHPDFSYYLLRLTPGTAQTEIEAYGAVLDRFDGLALLKLRSDFEPMLLDFPAHYRAKLPSTMALPDTDLPAFAPSLSTSPQQQAVISGLLNQVDTTRWFDLIIALVENEDLQQPGRFFHSRYSLRVREAVQFDGRPKPDHACDNAADFIAAQFRSYGLEVEFDPFKHRRSSIGEGLLGEYTMRNVVATLPGKGPNRNRIYMMVGHYDTISSKTPGWEESWRRMPAPGASDNASGIAEMLETARILSQQALDFTVQFIAFSGEELFLFGSKHYAQLVQERGDEIMGVIDYDLLGHDPDGNLDIHVLGDEQSQWLVNAFAQVAQRYNIEVDLRLKNDPSFIFSDHSPFWEIGVPAVMVAEESVIDGGEESTEYIHSQEDTLEKISRPLLGELATKLAVGTLAELARPIVTPADVTQVSPDIFWESRELGVSDLNPVKGDEITLRASLKNRGPVAVEEVTVRFVAVTPSGRSETISEQTTTLDVDQSQTFSATFILADWGVFTLRALANDDARVFESDFGNNRLETELTVTDGGIAVENIVAYPNPTRFDQPESALKLTYVLSRDADVVITIYDAFGLPILDQAFRAGEDGGRLGLNQDMFTWEGENGAGERVVPGVYICQVTATASTGESNSEGTKVAVIR